MFVWRLERSIDDVSHGAHPQKYQDVNISIWRETKDLILVQKVWKCLGDTEYPSVFGHRRSDDDIKNDRNNQPEEEDEPRARWTDRQTDRQQRSREGVDSALLDRG